MQSEGDGASSTPGVNHQLKADSLSGDSSFADGAIGGRGGSVDIKVNRPNEGEFLYDAPRHFTLDAFGEANYFSVPFGVYFVTLIYEIDGDLKASKTLTLGTSTGYINVNTLDTAFLNEEWNLNDGCDTYQSPTNFPPFFIEIVECPLDARYAPYEFEATFTIFNSAGSVVAGGRATDRVEFYVRSGPPPPPGTVRGPITRNTTWTKDLAYTLEGIVEVTDGATLTIEPGTTIRGTTNGPSALVIRRGSRIHAVGTQAEPIVFTSINPPGSRAPGDWGGVIVIGEGICNGDLDGSILTADDCFVEGLPNPFGNLTYGGNNPGDDSGTISYVRIEFAGAEYILNRDVNALSLYGVGSGTQIDHVQIHKSIEDGIAIYGGSVDVKYALATGIGDDSFDYSYGWNGRGQFWIVQQDESTGDRGIEAENNRIQNTSSNYSNRPLTEPEIYNYTFVGRFPSGVGDDNVGLKVYHGAGGHLYNGIVAGFGSHFLDIDDNATFDNCPTDTDADPLRIDNMIGALSGIAPIDPDPDNELQCVGTAFSSSDPRLVNPIDRRDPDFRPRNQGLVSRPDLVRTPPINGFFDQVNYLGAVEPGIPANATWYFGWTDFPLN